MYLIGKQASSLTCTLVGFGQAIILLFCTLFLFLGFGKIGTPGEKILSIFCFAVVASYGTTVVYILGVLYVKSGELVESWRCNFIGTPDMNPGTDWKLERMELKALQQMKLYAGDIYYLDHRSVLVLWEQIIDKTILVFSLQPTLFLVNY